MRMTLATILSASVLSDGPGRTTRCANVPPIWPLVRRPGFTQQQPHTFCKAEKEVTTTMRVLQGNSDWSLTVVHYVIYNFSIN